MADSKTIDEVKIYLDSLDAETRDAAYRYLQSDYVRADVRNLIDVYIESDDINEADAKLIEDDVVERYVYNCEYDCNVSYNDTLDTLVNEAMGLVEQKKKIDKETEKEI